MAFRHIVFTLVLGALIGACSHRRAVVEEPQVTPEEPPQAQAPAEPVAPPSNFNWTYEGDKGPQAWGTVSPDYIQCGQGKKQSPINLNWRKPVKKGKPRLDFSYTPSKVDIDISTPIPQIKFGAGNQLLLNGKVYNLERIEFHSPSEHNLSKNAMSMEIQFIHKSANSPNMAALSIFAIEGHENSLLGEVWTHFANGTTGFQFDAGKLIPPSKTFYHYQGSLTSPPCTEGVDWIVFNTPVELSQQQIVAFRSRFPANNRPLQPVGVRKISNH